MWKWIRMGWVAVAGLLLVAASADAADNRIVNLNQFTQQDLRAMAMGNAFGPVARGETALFYNPAGLVQYDFDLKAEFPVPVPGLKSTTGLSAITGFAGNETFIQDTSTVGDNPTDQELLDYLGRYSGTTQRFNLNALSSGVANLGYVNVGFGWGGLEALRYSLQFDDGGTPGSDLISISDDTLIVSEARLRLQQGGVAFKLGRGKVLLGIAAKSFKYSEKAQNLPYAQIITDGQLEFNPTGEVYPAASAYDIGMLYRMEFWSALKPQMSLTAYNVGGIQLKGEAETLDVPASYNIGFAFGPDTAFVHWLVSLEVEDVTDALKVTDFGTGVNATLRCNDPLRTETCVNQPRSSVQRAHIGAEVGLWRTPTGNNILSLRAGNNRGYFTYGWELNLWAVRVLYAKGADNLGWKDNTDKFEFTAYQLGIVLAW